MEEFEINFERLIFLHTSSKYCNCFSLLAENLYLNILLIFSSRLTGAIGRKTRGVGVLFGGESNERLFLIDSF